MKKLNHLFKILCPVFSLLFIVSIMQVPSSAYGASIAGTIYMSDGVTEVTGANIRVYAITTNETNPCGSISLIYNDTIDINDGSYLIENVSAGRYYLKTWIFSGNYLAEWWNEPESTLDCQSADYIDIAESDTVIDKHFRLDTGATISGTIFQSDGTTPILGGDFHVQVKQGNTCNGSFITDTTVNPANGTYTASGDIAAGDDFFSRELQASELLVIILMRNVTLFRIVPGHRL